MQALDFVNQILDLMTWGVIDSLSENETPQVRRVINVANGVLRQIQANQAWPELRRKGHVETWITEEEESTTGIFDYGSTVLNWVPGTGFDLTRAQNALVAVSDGTYSVLYNNIGSINQDAVSDSGWGKLDRAYTWQSDPDSFLFGFNTYYLPEDFDRLADDKLYNRDTGAELDLVTTSEMRKLWADQTLVTAKAPTKFCIEYSSTNPKRKLLCLNSLPDSDYNLEFDYLINHPLLEDDNVEILYPARSHLALIDSVKARLSRDIEQSLKAQEMSAAAIRDQAIVDKSPSDGATKLRISPRNNTRGFTRRR